MIAGEQRLRDRKDGDNRPVSLLVRDILEFAHPKLKFKCITNFISPIHSQRFLACLSGIEIIAPRESIKIIIIPPYGIARYNSNLSLCSRQQ